MIKRSIFILCLLFSSFGAVSHAVEPVSWSAEISQLHTPNVDTFEVAGVLAQVDECEFASIITPVRQVPRRRYLLYEYQKRVTVLWKANQQVSIALIPRSTHLLYFLPRSYPEAPEFPSNIS